MPKAPAKIGKYKVTAALAEGGMGAIYKALHPTLNRPVIIKMLTLKGSGDFERRFRREAQFQMDFRHEQIVQVYDHFKEGRSYYIVMEYVDGITLEGLIQQNKYLPCKIALLIFFEIAKALKYAHDHQIIHRDIKPANILISNEGVVKLVDFGVAGSLAEVEDDGLTKAGMTIGTPAYLAPEQIGHADLKDKRADIYALGVLLYEMVLGKKPFKSNLSPENITLIQRGKYTPPRRVNPQVEPLVQKIVRKAMHHKVKKRFSDLSEILKKLEKPLKKIHQQNLTQQALADYLAGKGTGVIDEKAGVGRGLKIAFSVLILIIITGGGGAVGGYWAYLQGYHYEYLYPDEYGSMKLSVDLNKGYKDPEDLFIKAEIFQNKDGKFSKIEGFDPDFEVDLSRPKKDSLVFGTKLTYLPQGFYKLILLAEGSHLQKEFYLGSRTWQKSKANQTKGLQLHFNDLGGSKPMPLNVHLEAANLLTGKPLSQASLELWNKTEWVPWKDLMADENLKSTLTTNKRYRFRVLAENYPAVEYPVFVQADQTELVLKAALVPEPGFLKIDQNGKEYEAKINGSEKIMVAHDHPKLEAMEDLMAQDARIPLAPGEYFVTVKEKQALFKGEGQTKKIMIEQGETTRLSIETDSDGNLRLLLP